MSNDSTKFSPIMTQMKALQDFRYYSEWSDELLTALQSDYGYQIAALLGKAFKLIEENSKP